MTNSFLVKPTRLAKPRPPSRKERARRLAEKTRDAYSADRYVSWEAAVRFFVDLGFTDAQVEWIVRSKLMRWASDQSSGKASTRHLFAFIAFSPTKRDWEYIQRCMTQEGV